ncbi:DUF1614 domain-containing protein [Aceticella autotrophica]|uniref:DUF1614 domain-containing protein n=1 Tax=Aceticella autotrophica TaxID=2755338 RepID=A0A975GB94_9THEO|nr:DUF1614 domain-containing protein [Aceticella autotrophica]QSZ27941.1 DUF1614 domain-containing protein [Aceticella autotrophica]
MTIGYILLTIAGLFVLFGFAHRVLDRMKMTDKWALLIIIGMIIGTLIPSIPLGANISINIGGAIIPMAVAVYLFIKSESLKEKMNAIFASLIAGAAVYIAGRLLPSEPEAMLIEPNYIYGIISGLIAYLFSRSRRCAFIAGVMGVVLSDITQAVINAATARPGLVSIGGAGAVDTVVISMIVAVLLSEVLGETREKLQGGTAKKNTEIDSHLTSTLIDDNDLKDREKDGEKDEKE